MKRLLAAATSMVALVALGSNAPVQGQEAPEAPPPPHSPDTSLTASLGELNRSGATGTAKVSVEGRTATVRIESTGHSPALPHAQHIHIGGEGVCPPASASGGDDLITTVEGEPFYGGVRVSLTTEGDVSADSALAVERFPVAEADGSLTYERSFELPEGVEAADVAQGVIVQHGIAELSDDPAAYDGEARSSLDPSLPLEATIPAACGALAADRMPPPPGEEPTVLATTLTGAREVGTDGSLGAGDPDALGAATVVVHDDRVCAMLNVTEFQAVAAHIHAGPVGVNGPVVVPLPTPGPDGRSGGCVDVDPAVAEAIAASPADHYVNVHDADYPMGAVRGNLLPAMEEGVLLGTRLAGTAEVAPDGMTGVGDPDGVGTATVAVDLEQERVCYGLSATAIELPAIGAHIHRGVAGTNGPVVIPLEAPDADGIVGGCVRDVEVGLLEELAADPAGFYVNVHTTDHPDGAVRGQLLPASALAG